VILGGPHPSITGRDALKSAFIDICVCGEGEVTIVELLKALEEDRDLGGVRGIIYKKGGQIIETGRREYIKDLSTLCFPYESAPLVLKDIHSYPLTSFNNVFANRGCPFDCTFCGSRYIWSRNVRFRPIDHVIREIQGLMNKGLRTIYFCDDTFGVNKIWLKNLCSALISDCPGLKWSCEIHARLIDNTSLSLMKKAGCYKIELGIESGNDEILKKMRKQITIEEGLSAAEKIIKYGIELHCYFLVGIPFETEETLRDTFVAIKKLKNRASIMLSTFCPFPNTELYVFCTENGLINENYDVALHNLQSPDCFCLNIAPDRFKQLVIEMEQFVDRSNRVYKLRRLFSSRTVWRIAELGIMDSVRKGMKIMRLKK
jgi:radical SAM superfamily enzyme YgiQ (UPF0313 family)